MILEINELTNVLDIDAFNNSGVNTNADLLTLFIFSLDIFK